MTFFQRLGGVLGTSIAGTIFANELPRNLVKYAPDAPAELVRNSVAVRTFRSMDDILLSYAQF